MSKDQSRERLFKEELASIVGRNRRSVDDRSRQQLFDALSSLERQALIGGASDRTLKDIAEARFLIGILRDSVRPVRAISLRGLLRARGNGRPSPHRETSRRPTENAGRV